MIWRKDLLGKCMHCGKKAEYFHDPSLVLCENCHRIEMKIEKIWRRFDEDMMRSVLNQEPLCEQNGGYDEQ